MFLEQHIIMIYEDHQLSNDTENTDLFTDIE